MQLTSYSKRALTGGIVSTVVIGLGAFIVGNVSGYEAKQLLEVSLDGVNKLCNTVVLASATILALLLTLLSISSSSDSKLKKKHYLNVKRVAQLDTIIFIVAMISFVLINIPITESDDVPTHWYITFYYISLGISSLLSGALISVVLMLYNTISNIINIVGLHQKDHPLLYEEENQL